MAYPAGSKYTKDHEWIEASGGTGKVGITDYAQQQLGDVVYVELPEAGQSISAGSAFGSIESVKAVSELFAPIGGEVTEVNPALKEHPESINADPHGTWMVRVKVTDQSGESSLLDSGQYERLLG